MSRHLTPLEVCERLIAPISKLGTALGGHEKYAYSLKRPSAWRDDGDLPPRAQRNALKFAEQHQIPLTAQHVIWGASEREIETLQSTGLAAK